MKRENQLLKYSHVTILLLTFLLLQCKSIKQNSYEKPNKEPFINASTDIANELIDLSRKK